MARNETKEPSRLLSSAIGLAQPKQKGYEYLSEHHSFGENARKQEIMQKIYRQQCLQLL